MYKNKKIFGRYFDHKMDDLFCNLFIKKISLKNEKESNK